MAKPTSFAEKAAKLARKTELLVMCPDTNKETRILNVKMIHSYKTDKGNIKFVTKNEKVYESTLKPYKP